MITRELEACPFCGTQPYQDRQFPESCYCDNRNCWMYHRVATIGAWQNRFNKPEPHLKFSDNPTNEYRR